MSSSTYPGHVLREGAHEPAVRRVKTRLNAVRNTRPAAEQPPLPEDQEFGPLTSLRVEQFQRHHRLVQDGEVGPITWAKLLGEPVAKDSVNGVRAFPNVVVRMDVACQSARTAPIRIIVLHDTEGPNSVGIGDLKGLGAFFDRLPTQASSHVAVDGEGQSARYVSDQRKAWHVAADNSFALGIEQIGFAVGYVWPDAQIDETARWVAYWAAKWDVPLIHSTERGVCFHSDLGATGGGHHDPGVNFPSMTTFLNRADHFAAFQSKSS